MKKYRVLNEDAGLRIQARINDLCELGYELFSLEHSMTSKGDNKYIAVMKLVEDK